LTEAHQLTEIGTFWNKHETTVTDSKCCFRHAGHPSYGRKKERHFI